MKFLTFEDFFAEVGLRPARCSIDRINANGHYEPGNVRWADNTVQARNKSASRIVEIDGVRRPLKDWCEMYDQPYKRVWERMRKGLSAQAALTSGLRELLR